MIPGDMDTFMAREGLRIVATGEAAPGTTGDAKPVVEVSVSFSHHAGGAKDSRLRGV